MPRTRRFLQVDVFGSCPGRGNPLAVVHDAAGMDEAEMQALAPWTNLSESVFLLPPDAAEADYRVRIFTPCMELPFAGHPSVGAAWAALDAGLAQGDGGTLLQECAAGLLPVRIGCRGSQLLPSVRSPRARPRPLPPPDWLLAAEVFGARRGALEPALWNNGPDWWLLELDGAAAVRGLQPDLGRIAGLPGKGKLAVFAWDASEDMLVVRCFAPGVGIAEDPATGSANASIAALLLHAGRLPGEARSYRASQGREIGRDAVLELELDADGQAWVGGTVHAVIRGTVDW